MKIRINPLTPLAFFAVALTGNIKLFLLGYLIMAVHEAAHLAAALCIGLNPESITFSPFGVNLKLRCKIINSASDEVILYLSGPLVNAVFALIALILEMPDFYRLNTALLVMNILPVSPLDGGMIVSRLLSRYKGRRYAQKLLSTTSVVMGVFLLFIACFGLYAGYINISLFIIAILFIGNVLTSKEMYDSDFISAVSVDKKRSNKANIVIIDKDHTRAEALKTLSPAYTTIGIIMKEDKKVSGIITEKELIENIDVL